MASAKRTGTVLLLGLAVSAMPATGLSAQAKKTQAVQLTLTTGTVLICEDRGDVSDRVTVYNIKLGEEQTYPKHKTFARVGPDDPPTRASGARTDPRKPEALEIRRIVTVNSSQLHRLGTYPENIASYAVWRTAQGKPTGKGLRLAVLPLQDTAGQVTGETTQRTEELTGELVRRGVSMVERTQLEKVLGEVLINHTSLFDPKEAARVGKQCGASAVLVGTLTPKKKKADLNLRLLATETGQIVDAFSLSDIEGLLDQRKPVVTPIRIVTPSLVGTWELNLRSKGAPLIATMRSDGSMEVSNGNKGKWTQDGLQFHVFVTRVNGVKVEWEGDLSSDGKRFSAKLSDRGGPLLGVRR